ALLAVEGFGDFLVASSALRSEFAIDRQVTAIEPGADRGQRSLYKIGLGSRRWRQLEPQHVAAGKQIAAVEDQAAFAIENAGARLGGRDQAAQYRGDAFRIDGEIRIFVGHAVAFAGLQIEQAVGIEGDGVALDGGRGGDRFRDDLGIDQKALRPRFDQAGAELRKIKNARHQGYEAGEVERNDASGEARERERKEELPGAP